MSLLLNGMEANERATLVELQEKGQVEELGILDKVLKVHSVAPASKGEGIICMIHEDANGISNRLSDNEKVEKAMEIHDKLEVDIAAYCKHWLNMRDRHNINGFNQLFKGGKAGGAVSCGLQHRQENWPCAGGWNEPVIWGADRTVST